MKSPGENGNSIIAYYTREGNVSSCSPFYLCWMFIANNRERKHKQNVLLLCVILWIDVNNRTTQAESEDVLLLKKVAKVDLYRKKVNRFPIYFFTKLSPFQKGKCQMTLWQLLWEKNISHSFVSTFHFPKKYFDFCGMNLLLC